MSMYFVIQSPVIPIELFDTPSWPLLETHERARFWTDEPLVHTSHLVSRKKEIKFWGAANQVSMVEQLDVLPGDSYLEKLKNLVGDSLFTNGPANPSVAATFDRDCPAYGLFHLEQGSAYLYVGPRYRVADLLAARPNQFVIYRFPSFDPDHPLFLPAQGVVSNWWSWWKSHRRNPLFCFNALERVLFKGITL